MGTMSRVELEARVESLESAVHRFEEVELALRESESKYRRLYDSMMDAFVRVDMAGRIVESNRAYQEMVGYTQEELQHLTYRDLTPASWHEMETKIIREQIMVRGHSDVYCKEYRRKNGDVFPIEIRTSLLRDNEGTPISMWGIVRDITDRKREEDRRRQTELQLMEAQKVESLCIMAGGVAHDFNNLLMGILGNAELALEESSQGTTLHESVQDIAAAAQRAADLCKQLLAYTGHGSITSAPVRFSDVVSHVVHLVAKTTPSKIHIEFTSPSDLPPVRGDAAQIQQMVLNLVVNAIEAIDSRGGTVRITMGIRPCSRDFLRDTHHGESVPTGDYVWMEVSDTGSGITADLQRRIFEPFFTTKFTGRGLGLSAALGIINSHKGTLRLNSRPGEGTSFLVLLPAIAEHIEPAKPAATPFSDRLRGKVLLVDDDEMVRTMGGKMLETMGLESIVACDGVEAIEHFRQHRNEIDAVLLDMTMPRLNGAETLDELRKIDANVRVILCSGYSAANVENRMKDNYMPPFLQKPYSIDQLRNAVADVLALRSPSRR